MTTSLKNKHLMFNPSGETSLNHEGFLSTTGFEPEEVILHQQGSGRVRLNLKENPTAYAKVSFYHKAFGQKANIQYAVKVNDEKIVGLPVRIIDITNHCIDLDLIAITNNDNAPKSNREVTPGTYTTEKSKLDFKREVFREAQSIINSCVREAEEELDKRFTQQELQEIAIQDFDCMKGLHQDTYEAITNKINEARQKLPNEISFYVAVSTGQIMYM